MMKATLTEKCEGQWTILKLKVCFCGDVLASCHTMNSSLPSSVNLDSNLVV